MMNIFCSGIGGMGLSAYAAYQRAEGHTVSGSERSESALLDVLRKQDIEISLTQDGSVVPPDSDLFIYTLALSEDHPELLRARALRIRTQSYFEALGDLTRASGKRIIAVCGTHGKSSTTAMAAKMLLDLQKDPSVIVGTTVSDLGGKNWRRGAGGHFIVEACEYQRSFLHLSPSIILLTNADGDHLDYFRDLADYEAAFEEFVSLLPKDGMLIAHGKEGSVQKIIEHAKRRGVRVIDADAFKLPELAIPGLHMRENAQLVLALGELLSLDEKSVRSSLLSYKGSSRRMELRGKTSQGALLIDDYGHHPKEVAATLQALKEAYPDRRLLCVFQPHTHDRTLKFYDDFTKAFRDADLVIIPNIFDARKERDNGTVDTQSFIRDLAQGSRIEVLDGHSLEETGELLRRTLQPNDVLVTMGAGDVWKIGDRLLSHFTSVKST